MRALRPIQRVFAMTAVRLMLRFLLVVAMSEAGPVAAAPEPGLIDDFSRADGLSQVGTRWRLVADGVMGGESAGAMALREVGGRRGLCLSGNVSLANGGGFVQVNIDLAADGVRDASGFEGVRLVVLGNGEDYGLHLKTAATVRPWQSYRAAFGTGPLWREVWLPFAAFVPYRLETPIDRTALRRLGIVAIGRAMRAEVCVAEIGFY